MPTRGRRDDEPDQDHQDYYQPFAPLDAASRCSRHWSRSNFSAVPGHALGVSLQFILRDTPRFRLRVLEVNPFRPAEGVGFEPTEPGGSTVFETATGWRSGG